MFQSRDLRDVHVAVIWEMTPAILSVIGIGRRRLRFVYRCVLPGVLFLWILRGPDWLKSVNKTQSISACNAYASRIGTQHMRRYARDIPSSFPVGGILLDCPLQSS